MRLWVDAQCLQTDSRKQGVSADTCSACLRQWRQPLGAMRSCCRSTPPFGKPLSEARDQALQLVHRDDIFLWQGAATSGEAVTGYTPERQQSELILSHHVRCLRADVCFTASSFEGRYDAAVPYLNASGPAMPWAALYFDAIPSRFPQHYLVGEFARSCNERWISALTRADALLAISQFSTGEAVQLTGNHPSIVHWQRGFTSVSSCGRTALIVPTRPSARQCNDPLCRRA